MLINLLTTWCNILTREKTNSKEDFLKPWTPPAHIITFNHQLDKHQNFCKSISTPVSDTYKILFFVVQMHTSKKFTEEYMINYEIIPTNEKKYWLKTLTYFTNLYAMQILYTKDRTTESRFESAANINHAAPPSSFTKNSFNMTRNRTSSVSTTQ